MIFDGERERCAVDESFDYVIVGSGAAGATAARVLADTGARIAVVEEGPALTTADFSDRLWPTFRRFYRQMGAQVAQGRTIIPVLQGSCLGGSTVINSAIVWRLPADVWQPWETEYGLGQAIPLDKLHHYWDQIEAELSTRPTPPAIWGENSRLLAFAAERMGLEGMPMRRNERNCQGSSRCSLGCPHDAKQSMLLSYLPFAAERGAMLFTSARVDRVILEGDRAVGVTGYFHRPQWQENIAPFTLHARQGVLIAASAVQTPGLLARSKVRSPHLGQHFQGHPGASLVGIFDDEVNVWSGATQGYEVETYRRNGRFKIETLSLPPELLFPRLPGVGRDWVERMAVAGHMAIWAVLLRAQGQGVISHGRSGTRMRFNLTPEDVANLRRGLRVAAELMFAAGAREVLPGVHGLPDRLTDLDQARLLEDGPDDPACYSLALSHMFGTARMSLRPAGGVVGPDFAVHGSNGFYVIDSSLFPTNLGVNPQHTIMAIAMHAAMRIAAKHRWGKES